MPPAALTFGDRDILQRIQPLALAGAGNAQQHVPFLLRGLRFVHRLRVGQSHEQVPGRSAEIGVDQPHQLAPGIALVESLHLLAALRPVLPAGKPAPVAGGKVPFHLQQPAGAGDLLEVRHLRFSFCSSHARLRRSCCAGNRLGCRPLSEGSLPFPVAQSSRRALTAPTARFAPRLRVALSALRPSAHRARALLQRLRSLCLRHRRPCGACIFMQVCEKLIAVTRGKSGPCLHPRCGVVRLFYGPLRKYPDGFPLISPAAPTPHSGRP